MQEAEGTLRATPTGQEPHHQRNLHKDYFAKIMEECGFDDVVNALWGLTEKKQKKHRRQAFLMACEKGRIDLVRWFLHEAPITLKIEHPQFEQGAATWTAIKNNHSDVYLYLCLSNNLLNPPRQCKAGGESFNLIGHLIQTRQKEKAFLVINTIRQQKHRLNISLGKNKILKELHKNFEEEIMRNVMQDQDIHTIAEYVEQNPTLQQGAVASWVKEEILRTTAIPSVTAKKRKI